MDNSVFMAAKWQMYGGKGILKVYPGAPHGFVGFPEKSLPAAGDVKRDMVTFLRECLSV